MMRRLIPFLFALLASASYAQSPPVQLKDGIVKRTTAQAPTVGTDCTGAGQAATSVPVVFVYEGADAGQFRCCDAGTELWVNCGPSGTGDMLRSTYDSDTDGFVDGLDYGTAFPGAPTTGDVFVVTDDSASGACDSAAGSAVTLCRWNGSAWAALGGGGGGSSAFSAVTSGTNTTATMTVGSGATLTVQAGTLLSENLNAVRYMDQLATGGTGVDLANAWSGWWSSLAANTTHRFPKGYYVANDSVADIDIPSGATILCDEGAIFTFSAARPVVDDLFEINDGVSDVTMRGCRFEPGATVPEGGMADGTGGRAYIRIGSTPSSTISNVTFENNRFGLVRWQSVGGGQVLSINSSVSDLRISNNVFETANQTIGFNSSTVSDPVWEGVSIVGNISRVVQGGLSGTYSEWLAVGNGSQTYRGIAREWVVADNTLIDHNSLLSLTGAIDGAVITGNHLGTTTARDDWGIDFFIQIAPNTGYRTITRAVTVSGNNCSAIPMAGPGLDACGIQVKFTQGATITGNTIEGGQSTYIDIGQSKQVTVSGNTIDSNGLTNYGIFASSCGLSDCDVANVAIVGNTIIDADVAAVYLEQSTGTLQNVSVIGNTMIQTDAFVATPNATDYFFGYLGTPSGVVVSGNVALEYDAGTSFLLSVPPGSSGWNYAPTMGWVLYGPNTGSVNATVGRNANVDISFTFDQGTGTDPRIVWDDNPGQFEFDFDASLNDGTNPRVTSSAFVGALTGNVTGTVSGNAGTATALAANGSNCSAGSAAGGVNASGAAESCIDPIVSTEIDTSAELAGILGDETGSGSAVFADGPTFGNTGATFGTGVDQTPADVLKLLQYRDIRFEVPTVTGVTGSTAFTLSTCYATSGGVRDNGWGVFYNARCGMGKINANEWAFGQFLETNWDQSGAGTDRWLEYNWDFYPEPEGSGTWRPHYWVLDTKARSNDGAVLTWAVNTFRTSANNALLIKYDTATGAYGSTIDFNYSADVLGAGKTRAHYLHNTSDAQASAYAFSTSRIDKGTDTASHAREYGGIQSLITASSATASHDYGYLRGNRTEVNLTGSAASQTGEEAVGFSTRITVNPSAASHNYDDVYGLNVEWNTTKDEASIMTRAAGVRVGAWATTTTNRQADYRMGVWVGDQKCPTGAAGDQCAAVQIDSQTNGDGSAGNLNFGGGDYANGHLTFRNGYVHLYNSADATYSFNTSALRLTRNVAPAALATRSGGLVATANGGTAASATTVTIEDGDHWLQPTGSTAITTIATCDTANKGKQLIVLCGAYTGTITNTTGNLRLTANLVCTADDTLSLICDGTNWLETSRAVN